MLPEPLHLQHGGPCPLPGVLDAVFTMLTVATELRQQ